MRNHSIFQSRIKRSFSIALMAFLTFGNSFAQRFQVGELEFEIISDEDKTVKLIGGENSSISALSIPQSVDFQEETYSVTTIENAYNNSDLVSVYIPNSIKIIDNSFANCNNLKSANIGQGLEIVSGNSFCGTNTYFFVNSGNLFLSSRDGILYNKTQSVLVKCQVSYNGAVDLPETVEELAEYSFMANLSLSTLNIPKSVTQIGDDAFLDCLSLESVICNPITPPDNLCFIDNETNKPISCNVYVPDDSLELYDLKYGCSFRLYPLLYYPVTETIRDGIIITKLYEDTAIITSEFSGIYNYYPSSYKVPGSIAEHVGQMIVELFNIEVIGWNAFATNNNLKNLTLPKSIKRIAGYAFSGCINLQNLLLLAEEPPILSSCAFIRQDSYTSTINPKIYVPDNALELYANSEWGAFDLYPLSTYVDSSGIGSIFEDGNDTNDVFSIDGQFIKSIIEPNENLNLEKGLYIIGGKKVVVP